ncbi:hypothetical protein PHLCEN_2v9568 [Hermanssonia centrifuga]|uniref:Uncharacterized protein n=1 Tax=Hermanssonia centrifuga TaxID=98765 RepID=A0A2R6NQE0_9APHY|nr:hypothetical protein PHLCEN_2v9568 [Hermanssonia centrifuga]
MAIYLKEEQKAQVHRVRENSTRHNVEKVNLEVHAKNLCMTATEGDYIYREVWNHAQAPGADVSAEFECRVIPSAQAVGALQMVALRTYVWYNPWHVAYKESAAVYEEDVELEGSLEWPIEFVPDDEKV